MVIDIGLTLNQFLPTFFNLIGALLIEPLLGWTMSVLYIIWLRPSRFGVSNHGATAKSASHHRTSAAVREPSDLGVSEHHALAQAIRLHCTITLWRPTYIYIQTYSIQFIKRKNRHFNIIDSFPNNHFGSILLLKPQSMESWMTSNFYRLHCPSKLDVQIERWNGNTAVLNLVTWILKFSPKAF